MEWVGVVTGDMVLSSPLDVSLMSLTTTVRDASMPAPPPCRKRRKLRVEQPPDSNDGGGHLHLRAGPASELTPFLANLRGQPMRPNQGAQQSDNVNHAG